MNNSSYPPTKHEPGNDSRRIAYSSSASPSVGELEAKISSLKMLRVRMSMASKDSSPSTELYNAKEGTAAADANAQTEGSGDVDVSMRVLHSPTKSENNKPGPALNPATCASGPPQIGGG